jgi:hypothetical protein
MAGFCLREASMEEKKTDLEKFKENVEQYNQGKDRESGDTPDNKKPRVRNDPPPPAK